LLLQQNKKKTNQMCSIHRLLAGVSFKERAKFYRVDHQIGLCLCTKFSVGP